MSCKIIEKFHKLGRLDTNPQSCLTIDICVGYSYNNVLYTTTSIYIYIHILLVFAQTVVKKKPRVSAHGKSSLTTLWHYIS
jgi:hypothetical protein